MSEPIKTVIDSKEYSKLEAENQRLRELLRDSLAWLQVAQNVNVTVCESLEIAELRRNIAAALTDSTD